jgi:hypothetical protein
MDTSLQNIKNLLNTYRENKAILEEKKKAYESFKKLLQYGNKKPNFTVDECIEGMSLPSPTLSHIPRSVTNKFSSVVENVFLNYQEEMKPNRFNNQKILQSMADITVDIESLIDSITLTDNLVNALTDKNRYIIEHTYIYGYTNKETNIFYNQKFPYPLQERAFKQSKINAIKDMAEILDKMGGKVNEV